MCSTPLGLNPRPPDEAGRRQWATYPTAVERRDMACAFPRRHSTGSTRPWCSWSRARLKMWEVGRQEVGTQSVGGDGVHGSGRADGGVEDRGDSVACRQGPQCRGFACGAAYSAVPSHSDTADNQLSLATWRATVI
ncbi:hypothetical protein B0H10DRAFT_1969138 [Mycena sp. CBHHK59/15]|nr:hypothetical protein B0H10DRAFT_1969138 [Mycena sp. CBHHK59/15]